MPTASLSFEVREGHTDLNLSRIRTKYLNGTTPDQYQYQEMGPMRCKNQFPIHHHITIRQASSMVHFADRVISSCQCYICRY